MSAGISAPLRVLVVDDEAPARQRLRALLDDLANGVEGEPLPNTVVGEVADGAAALDWLRQGGGADVALVDIRMPGMDGMALAEALRQLAQPPAVIFVTAYDSHAVAAFDLNATDYLLKPVRLPRLRAALLKLAPVVTVTPPACDFLTCHDRGALLRLPLADILYLRADHKYVEAGTASRSYLLDESLVQLEQEFGDRFLRVHRSVLVARAAVAGCKRADASTGNEEGEGQWLVMLRGGVVEFPVSRRQWPQVKALLRG